MSDCRISLTYVCKVKDKRDNEDSVRSVPKSYIGQNQATRQATRQLF